VPAVLHKLDYRLVVYYFTANALRMYQLFAWLTVPASLWPECLQASLTGQLTGQ
jgi:hypothetical protein